MLRRENQKSDVSLEAAKDEPLQQCAVRVIASRAVVVAACRPTHAIISFIIAVVITHHQRATQFVRSALVVFNFQLLIEAFFVSNLFSWGSLEDLKLES
jgi:phage gp46-like protein